MKRRPKKQPRKQMRDVQSILDRIEFMDRKLRLMRKGDGFLVQVTYYEDDVKTGEKDALQRARKWYVSSFSTTAEIVRTVHKAVRASMEHVVDEHFLFDGEQVFSPHYDAEILTRLGYARQDARIPILARKRRRRA